MKMPVNAYGMRIYPFDNQMRWRVTSESETGKEYIVDLTSYWCNGQCSCEDFQYRHEPLLTRGYYDKGQDSRSIDLYRCKHIRAVREVFCNHMIALVAAQKPENAAQPQA